MISYVKKTSTTVLFHGHEKDTNINVMILLIQHEIQPSYHEGGHSRHSQDGLSCTYFGVCMMCDGVFWGFSIIDHFLPDHNRILHLYVFVFTHNKMEDEL